MNKYLKEAKNYYKIALKELSDAMKDGKLELAVDACEKGWLALNLALSAEFVKKGVEPRKLPRTYRGKRRFLRNYADKEMRRFYESAMAVLHVEGFWDRDPDYPRVQEVLEDVKEYIEKIEKA